jgi:hypothetical protein
MMRVLDRRQFTSEASLAFLAGVAVVISDCGGGHSGDGGGSTGNDGYSPTASTPPATVPTSDGSKSASISGNHGHSAVITQAQMLAGGAVSLDIQGTATHDHVVNLSATAVGDIRDGKKVATESTSTQGHTHTVTFNPDSSDTGPGY